MQWWLTLWIGRSSFMPYHCIVSLRLGHTRWHVAATHWGEKSLLVYRLGDKESCATHCSTKSLCVLWGIVVKIFVSATEFCCGNKLHKFNLIWFCATCCGDKIQSRRQRFSQKFSSIHGVICRRDVMQQHVARVFWPVNEKLGSTLSHYPGSGCSIAGKH